MVCKKCGNELIEGIDICPFCGETSEKQDEINLNIKEIVNNLDDLKIELDEEEIEDKEQEALALTQDLENLKMEIESLETEEKDSVELEEQKIVEESKEENDEVLSISDIVSNIKSIQHEENVVDEIPSPNTDLSFDKIDMSNYLEDNEKEMEITEDTISENSEEVIENNISDNESKLETNEEITDEVPNINDLINDLKEIPVEEINEEKKQIVEEVPNTTNEEVTYDLLNDLRSIKVEGIKPILNEELTEEVKENNDSPIKNDYLITNFELNNEVSNDEEVESNTEEIQNVIETNEIDLSQIDEDNLRLKSDKLRIDDKEDKVYINENLSDNVNVVEQPQELEPTNNELIQQYNSGKAQEFTPVVEKTTSKPKSSPNYMVAILFVLMIILGIAAALVFSHIFNL